MHTFLYFVVSLQSIFCTLGLIFVFDVNIYSSSLRLFKINLVVSVLPATNRQYFVLALSLPLASCYICFKYLDPVKRVIFPASDKATFDFIEISLELRILESVICTFLKRQCQPQCICLHFTLKVMECQQITIINISLVLCCYNSVKMSKYNHRMVEIYDGLKTKT